MVLGCPHLFPFSRGGEGKKWTFKSPGRFFTILKGVSTIYYNEIEISKRR